MKWEMEVANWLVEESKNTRWTAAENKIFENALAVHDTDTPDRWHKVAAMIPGKTAEDVLKQYRELVADVSNIEAGLIPIPGYSTSTSPFTLEWVSNHGYDGFGQQPYGLTGKRSSSIRPPDQERKKGVPWTEEEHKLFLMGLKKYGKGDWRNISRNFVITRTPTQVASHAQKYFIRQVSGGKDKRRASIHDITTVNLNEIRTPSPDSKGPSPEQEAALVFHQANSDSMRRTHCQWNHQQSKGAISSNSVQENMFMASSFGINSHGLKMQGQELHRSSVRESSHIGAQNLVFQMQASQRYPYG
ncbi:DIV1A protein [Tripterygium wilfordii]|uniref:DIV1A protein n=1 Tax=Tripterygium wilfordii TaxID=458696 RepID=A0A7J7DE15_TRIWF|nr:transcription factor DIVARICATA-like [Tripterygium wilfordii]KAF5744534.1 DIV1A protein [Tripterygium wilfordii]